MKQSTLNFKKSGSGGRRITVTTLTGTFNLDVEPSDFVERVKSEI